MQILYNYQIMEGQKIESAEDGHNSSEFDKDRIGAPSEYTDPGQIYNVELTVSQANSLAKILPKGYSMHVDRAMKTKRVVKRKFGMEPNNYKSINQGSEDVENNQVMQEKISVPIQLIQPIQTINYDEMINKCNKILNLLNKNKSSWPFRQPVDPIGMCIPEYADIVTNPMDLTTVGENLAYHKYSNMLQFYADIHLIIRNSYTFNKNNQQFCLLTAEFEKYFQKIKSQPLPVSKPELPSFQKIPSKAPINLIKKESNPKMVNQLTQRKQLAMKLKYLPRQELANIIRMISDNSERNSELNLQTLAMEKVRVLQDYIQKKENSARTKEEAINSLGNESSFQEDSSDNC